MYIGLLAFIVVLINEEISRSFKTQGNRMYKYCIKFKDKDDVISILIFYLYFYIILILIFKLLI